MLMRRANIFFLLSMFFKGPSIKNYFMYIYVCMYVYHVYTGTCKKSELELQRQLRAIVWVLGTEIISLQEQQLLLTTEPSSL